MAQFYFYYAIIIIVLSFEVVYWIVYVYNTFFSLTHKGTTLNFYFGLTSESIIVVECQCIEFVRVCFHYYW